MPSPMPQMPDVAFFTARSGRWSSPSTWKDGKIPIHHAAVVVNPKHTLTLDISPVICGLTILKGGTFSFYQKKSITLVNCGNIEVYGRFLMKPLTSNVTHTVRFNHIDESKFHGGGMMIMPDDIGLWVRDEGILEIAGTPKTAWTNLAVEAFEGSTQILLKDIPNNWKPGDEISISPTNSTQVKGFFNEFEVRTIVDIKGNLIILEAPLDYNHPVIEDPRTKTFLTAEVKNLTRNAVIKGEGDGTVSPLTNGRAHINIGMTLNPMMISNLELRHMGPRQFLPQHTESVLGRYALHFHHCGDNSRGSIIDGVVVRDCGGHAFVPHASHGITFKNCISFNTFDDAYWWDIPPDNGTSPINNSDDIIFDSCIAALTKTDPAFRGYRLASFLLGSGLRNIVKNCIAVGNQGNGGAAGFLWPESSNYTDNVWIFNEGNLAHNNKTNGIFVWENDPNNHIINEFIAYHNGKHGVEHGAYVNAYKYSNMSLLGNSESGFLSHATPIKTGQPDSHGYIMSITDTYSTDALFITKHTLFGKGAVLIKNCTFSKVIISELPKRVASPPPGLYDFVNCNIDKKDFIIEGIEQGSRHRVQRADGTAFQLDDKGTFTDIPTFYKV